MRFGSLVLEEILDIDLASVFAKNDLFLYFNPDGGFNYSKVYNALLLENVAQDLLPLMVSELILLKWLFMMGSVYTILDDMITARYKKAYEEGDTGCFTVFQNFPGIFTLLCYWANGFRKHKLGFVQTLEGLNNGKNLVKENYIVHMKNVSREITTVALELIDVHERNDLSRVLKDPIYKPWRKAYNKFNLMMYERYLKSHTF